MDLHAERLAPYDAIRGWPLSLCRVVAMARTIRASSTAKLIGGWNITFSDMRLQAVKTAKAPLLALKAGEFLTICAVRKDRQ